MYGFNHRFHESFKRLYIIKSNELGEIINVRAVYGKAKMTTLIKLIGELKEVSLEEESY